MTRTNVPSSNKEPTIVLVHGALTDASVWREVTLRLQASGHVVVAPALPMRGLESDAAYLAAFLGRIEGPIVLVGHSYAGAVISHPAPSAAAAVAGLVFIAAFQPDEGETAGELNERSPGTLLTPENLEVVPSPLGGDDLTLRAERFAQVYAADVEPRHAAVMAVSQRPVDPAALGQPLRGRPSWRTTPSWVLVCTEDRSLPPEILRFMAARAGSRVVEIESSHAAPVAHPRAVSDLIAEASAAIRPTPSTVTN